GVRKRFLNQLLTDAHSLKVHPEDVGYLRGFRAQMVLAIDLVEDCVHLELIVTTDVLEAGGPVTSVVVRWGIHSIHWDITHKAVGRSESRQADGIGIDFRRIVIVNVAGVRCTSRA